MGNGLYVHVPFCRQKCAYCDFYSIAASDAAAVQRYLHLLQTELKLRSQDLAIDTVFFGGGTPSLLTAQQISAVLEGISRYFCLHSKAEITIEANPETADLNLLADYRAAGVNRVSWGIQTLDDSLLAVLGRRHSAAEALRAVELARRAGIENISCDLIYGIPGQDLDSWQHDLQLLSALDLPHLSLYALEIYDHTPLGRAVRAGHVARPNDELTADLYQWAKEYLPMQGLLQYEISNWARPGRECRHNINYWRNGDYVGVGPAACSYLDGVRFCNVADLATYGELVQQNRLPVDMAEELDERTSAAETVILGLRLVAGVDAQAFEARYGYTMEDIFGDVLTDLLRQGWLRRTDNGYALPSELHLVANTVFCAFLPDSNT